MGPKSDSNSVVNEKLQIHDIPNLRVADASIMPEITNANIMAPIVVIAEKVSDFIKGHWEHPFRPHEWEDFFEFKEPFVHLHK